MTGKWTVILFLLGGVFFTCLSSEPSTVPFSPHHLDLVLGRGRLIVATNDDYLPQSDHRDEAVRTYNTQCAPTEYTATEMVGFEIDVAVEIAQRLGVEACFITAEWDQIINGNWQDRWDISLASITITPNRIEKFYFTQPYFVTPVNFFVPIDNSRFTQPSDLAGKRVGVCVGCTYEDYLKGDLAILGQDVNFVPPPQVVIVGYANEETVLKALERKEVDAILTAVPVGREAIESGFPLKPLGKPIFHEYLAAAIDKNHSAQVKPFLNEVTHIIQQMHEDGTLNALSQKYYDEDLTTPAQQFEISILKQFPK